MNPPIVLQSEVMAMTVAIRSATNDSDTPGIHHYRQCIRGNILDVLGTTYASTCHYFSDLEVKRLIDDFMENHSAAAPEFHHIATELLMYVTDEQWLPPLILKVMEYEWLLLMIEIDPGCIAKNTPLSKKQIQDNLRIIPNPTLYCIQLPFTLPLGDIEANSDTTEILPRYYYMICRNNEHDIIYKELNEIDRELMPLLAQSKGMDWEEIHLRHALHVSETELINWLYQTHNMQFIMNNHQEVV
ncbi:DUF2063 domain-containing protein [Cobetia sp. UCD-24C]|uniref:DUF2063 domain-containing protein n=1 Tax=Cobetia sp. UCD-24C TaxID=1716176 RepID=UPI0006CA4540|nr:DUF2063 domain-containing protein [Cobetia sp. UCD-24C]